MIKITKFIVAPILALLLSSCWHSSNLISGINGSGTITTKTKTINENFKNIEVTDGINVIVEQADNASVTVKTDDNLQKNIIIEIENGVLKIESAKSYNSDETPLVTVKMPVINGLKASGGSQITSKNTLITENINVESNSGSSINITTEADYIKMKTSSGSSIDANGKALKAEVSSESGSEINAKNLMSNEVVAESESGSSISVYAILKLNAKASSGSSITYHKNTKEISKDENSGASIDEE